MIHILNQNKFVYGTVTVQNESKSATNAVKWGSYGFYGYG